MKASFVIYEGADGQWYWRLVAKNGRTVAQGEGYANKRAARRGVEAVTRAAAEASMARCRAIQKE